MIDISPHNKVQCCGCAGCAQVCPAHCIVLEPDEEGFLYPRVDVDACINCGRCEAVCPVIARRSTSDSRENDPSQTHAFGGYHADADVRQDSSSGGAFTMLAEWALSQGGVVYGCALDEHMVARHQRVADAADLSKLRRSKYVQSDTRGIYASVRKDLRDGRRVLFVGTPCQVAGLRTFLGKDYPTLLTCDFICHGVPSPRVFADYLRSVEKRHGSTIQTYRFRTKDKGWSSSALQLGTEAILASGVRVRNYPAFRDSFMCGFLCDLYLRPICHDCPFKELPRHDADVTIADFWGVRKDYPELDDKRGTSLLLAHSDKALGFLQQVDSGFTLVECSVPKATRANVMLTTSTPYNAKREDFFRVYRREGYEAAERKFLGAHHWFFRKVALVLGGNGLIAQAIKFCMVGVTNFAISYLINLATLWILRPLDWQYDYVIANIMGFLLSVLWSFYWNSHYVFGGEDKGKGFGLKALLRTYASYAFTGLVLNNVLSTIWISVLGLPKWVAPILNLPFSVPANFLLSKLWAYRRDA